MSKYYEQVKSNYSRDVDHLINFKRDGLWIKEKINERHRFIYSKKLRDYLKDLTILHLDKNSNLLQRILAVKADIRNNEWKLYDVKIYNSQDGVTNENEFEILTINSIYNLNKINNLFKNFDTMSFLDLSLNYNKLIESGYNKNFLSQNLHSAYFAFFYYS